MGGGGGGWGAVRHPDIIHILPGRGGRSVKEGEGVGVGAGRVTGSGVRARLRPLHPAAHQAGKHRHHHLGLDLLQVLRKGVDPRADLPRHGNGVSMEGRRRCLPISTVGTDTSANSILFSFLKKCTLLTKQDKTRDLVF